MLFLEKATVARSRQQKAGRKSIKVWSVGIKTENKTIAVMIRIYCRDMHYTKQGLCKDCEDLQNYAFKRIDHCPFKAHKPACNKCKVHCYSPEKRDRIKKVMRHSGKKMLLRHPYLSIVHLLKVAGIGS